MGLFDNFKSNKILTPDERRIKNIEKIKKMGIAYNDNLPTIPSSDRIKLKSAEEVKKRALACMLSIQLAYSISNGEYYSDSLLFVLHKMEEWNLSLDDFLPKERVLIENKMTKQDNENEFTKQDLIDIIWSYETYWVLIWALDLITDKELLNVTKVCNTERAMAISGVINSIELKIKNIEKILDIADLFYCYHWACVEKRINSDTEIGKLNPEVVSERRKGLEWLINDEKDWNKISLDT